MGGAVSSIAGGLIASRNADRAADRAEEATRRFARTGPGRRGSRFDTATGEVRLKRNIKRRTIKARRGIRDLRDPANQAFDDFGAGIAGIRERLSGVIDDFSSNTGAFIQSQLTPIQERIAEREGRTERDLARREIFGSFGEQAKASVTAEGARAEADVRAQAENERVNNLGNLLNLDSNFLRQALAGETGRIDMMARIETLLSDMNQQEFNREIDLLQLGSGQGARSGQFDRALLSSEGVAQQATLQALGEVGTSIFGSGGQTTTEQR
jgi:hypothetical protein